MAIDFNAIRPSNRPYSKQNLWSSVSKINPLRGISSKNGVAHTVILNGKYGDRNDTFEEVTYIGEGGLDPASGSITTDQKLVLGNLALLKAYSAGSKVLVFRGSKAQAYPCTTPGRFRFDGAYNVANWCQARTKKGVMIYKFKLKRVVADALHNHFLGPKPHATAPKVNISAMRLRFNRKKRRARL